MKISSRRDIEAPLDIVFSVLQDFDATAEMACRANRVDIERLDDGRNGPAAAAWRIGFSYRGRPRTAQAHVVAFAPPEQIAVRAAFEGATGLFNTEIVALDPARTRLFCSVDISPETLKGRILVQSLKLMKSTLTRRLEGQLERFAARVEAHARASE